MEMIVHRSRERGKFENEWLSTRYSFSFANWYNPQRMGFGALRVLNDDTIAPDSGFDMHPHRDMEIVTIVTGGELTHKDSMGNMGVVPAGDVQAMSAGSGVVHAEYNASPDTTLTLFQLWIETSARGAEPAYGQRQAGFTEQQSPGITPLVGPPGTPDSLTVRQDAYLSRLVLDEHAPHTYKLHAPEHGLYVFVIDGVVEAAGERLEERDAVGVWDTPEVRSRRGVRRRRCS